MPQFEQFANLAQTILGATIGAGATTLSVKNAAAFPVNGQFRIVIDSEIFLVTAVSGNNFTVVPGYEGSMQAGHNSGAPVAHVLTAGVAASFNNRTIGRYNFYDYSPASIGSTQDVTTVLQNFLLYCQLIALTLKGSALDDQALRIFVTAYLPRGDYYITSPVIVPELVNLECDGVIVRNGSSGTITANYNGDTTTHALANLYQPAIIIVPRAHCKTINLYSNNDGVHLGAGMFVGRNWTMQSLAVGSSGSGYIVGDTITCAQPSLSPYIATTATVTAVNGSGGITAVSVTEPGAYGLPPVLQAQQWTAANGFSVFDGSGNLLTTGGTGSGATLTPTWVPDWVSGNTTYQMGRGGLIADTVLKHIRIMHVDTTTDSNYGPMIALMLRGLNMVIDDVEVQGGVNGIYFNYASDVRAQRLNAVASTNGIISLGGSDIIATDIVVDTPHGAAVYIDQGQGFYLQGRIFNRNLSNYTGSDNYTIRVGYNSNATVGQDVEGLVLDFQLTNAGSSNSNSALAGNPAIYLAYMKGCRIDLAITNYTTAATPAPITSFATFGSGVDASNALRGSIDQINGTLFNGTIPGCAIDIWDASAGGYARASGTYELYGSSAPTSSTGANKAGTGSSYINTTSGARYINTGSASSPSWHAISTS